MFLDSDQIWIVGNIPALHQFHRIHSQVLLRPAPHLEIFAKSLHPNLPTKLVDWKHAQDNEPDFLSTLDPDTLATCNGLTVYKDADLFPVSHPRSPLPPGPTHSPTPR